ncbi:hypothetical protein Lal_00026710 [Lupinus albus]|nr:hypothetical protein Lal_00026710 [Lupinus albus]
MNPILWEIPILTLVVSCWNRIGMGSQYCGYLELALEAIFLGVFKNDSYSAVRNRITESWAVLSWGRRVRNRITESWAVLSWGRRG